MPIGCFNRISPWSSTCHSNSVNSKGTSNLPVNKLKMQTLFDVIYCRLQVNKYNQCIGDRDESSKYLTYHWITYDQLVNESRLFASGLLSLTLSPGQGTKIAIYASNCSSWVVSLFALFHESIIAVPIYDCINDNDYTYIVNETQVECIITDTPRRTQRVIRRLNETESVKIIISRDEPWQEDINVVEEKHCHWYSFAQVMTRGKQRTVQNNNNNNEEEKFHSPRSTDIAEICYTPGTTGKPKGVLLTHGNLVASLEQVNLALIRTLNIERETLFLFVSLSHPFSLIGFLSIYTSGGRTAMFSGEVSKLIGDIKFIQPSILLVIPRFLDNIFNRIVYSARENVIKAKLMEYSMKLLNRQDNIFTRKGRLLTSFVFAGERSKILGDNVRLIISGTGALSSNVLQFLRIALDCVVINSYGLTETAGFTALTSPDNLVSLYTGSPLACNEIKLIDLPEFGHYVSKTGIGEICVRGLNVSAQYYSRESKVKVKRKINTHHIHHDPPVDVDDDDKCNHNKYDWFATGDIGTRTPSGSLRVIERKENIVKLQRGLFISLEKVESIYNQSAFVSECFVDSDDDGKFFVAIVVPEVDYLNAWCISNRILLNTEQACSDFLFKHQVIIDMIRIGEREGLKSFQQVRNIHLHPRPFSIENNLLTPTYMTRRCYCKLYFQQIVRDLISHIDRQEENEMAELSASLGLW